MFYLAGANHDLLHAPVCCSLQARKKLRALIAQRESLARPIGVDHQPPVTQAHRFGVRGKRTSNEPGPLTLNGPQDALLSCGPP